jgi:hypothetical protein
MAPRRRDYTVFPVRFRCLTSQLISLMNSLLSSRKRIDATTIEEKLTTYNEWES